MIHDKRGFMAVGLGAWLLLAAGCDDGDDLSDDTSMDDADDDQGEDDGPRDEQDDELTGCALNQTIGDCIAELGCSPVFGNALIDVGGAGNAGWCTEPVEQFIGCVTTLNLCHPSDKVECEDPCPTVDKILCDGDNYWRSTGCVPGNLELCNSPGESVGDC